MNRMLSADALARAAAFLAEKARPLERSTWDWIQGEAGPEAVREALAAYQRSDGGFGRALEPDIQAEGSSVYATTVALQTLADLNAPAEDPMVQRTMGYLTSQYDAEQAAWPMVPSDLDSAPHAPWWEPEAQLGGRLINPRAEILAYGLRWPGALPEATQSELLRDTLDLLEARTEEIEQHELLCALRLLRAPGLAEGHRSRLTAPLQAAVLRLVASDGAAWSEYGLQPIWVAEAPDLPFAEVLAGPIEANLDWLIEQQEPSGAWSPAWDWSFVDAAAWARAKRAWQGILTLKTLRALRAYGRLPVA
jgi:hypothetical protein